MNKALLTLKQVNKKFTQNTRRITVLNNIDMIFMQDQTYAITGHSGAGKSTLIHVLAGLDSPDSGAIFFNNTPVDKLLLHDLAAYLNKSIGLMFQSPHLIRELTVLENIMLPGMISNCNKEILKKKAITLLEQVNLPEKALCMPGELSGGQKQRVALARALINEPLFLLADEPTGNLDHKTGKAIVELILECQKKWGMGIIVSSHDAYVFQAMDQVYELVGGTLIRRTVSLNDRPELVGGWNTQIIRQAQDQRI